MEFVPVHVLKDCLIPLLSDKDLHKFRILCKWTRAACLEEFVFAKHIHITLSFGNLGHHERTPCIRSEKAWNFFLASMRYIFIQAEWNDIYHDINRIFETRNKCLGEETPVLKLSYATGEITLPDSSKFWHYMVGRDSRCMYRTLIRGAVWKRVDVDLNKLAEENFPLSFGYSGQEEVQCISNEDMIKHLKEFWENKCRLFIPEVNVFRKFIGWKEI